MALESKVCSPFRRLGNDVRFNQFSFAHHANLGQSLLPQQTRDLPSLSRRSDTKLRAERVTRRPPQEDWDSSWQKTDRDDSRSEEKEEGKSVWDSNAEHIRRRRRPKKVSYYSRSEVEEALPPSMREGNDRSGNSKWDYETADDGSGDGRGGNYDTTDRSGESSSRWNYGTADWAGESRSRWDYGTTERSGNRDYERSDGRSEGNEWDYESEPSSTAKTKPFWQRWFADRTGVAAYEDEDYEEEEDNWLSWLNVDVKEAFMLLRWGLPAAFLLCTAVIPAMIGNPLMLLFGFTIFPTVAKFVNPVVKDIFRSVENGFESDRSTSSSKKKRSQAASAYSRRPQDTAQYDDFGSPSQPISGSGDFAAQQSSRSDDFGSSPSQPMNGRSYDAENRRPRVPSRRNSLGGWDDLVDDRSRESQWPLQRRGKTGGKKLAKRGQQPPFVIRLILAFFPFLRGWGGLF